MPTRPSTPQFRREFRAWLEANLSEDLKVEDAQDQRISPDREILEKRIAWQKKMHAAGWVGISWPKEYGGRGANFMQQVIFDEEYFRAHAPILPCQSAINLLGPTLIHWGTEAQKTRHLPKILSRRRDAGARAIPSRAPAAIWRASEPARSISGDHFVVNGQKVWTSGAHFADWCFLLVRTDPEAPKHHGISYLLVDMKTPGRHGAPAGAAQRPPAFQRGVLRGRRGAEGEPRRQAQRGLEGRRATTLMFERGGAGGRDHAAQIARLVELAKQFPNRQEPAWRESHIRQQLAQLAIETKALQVTRLRGLTRRLRGEPPGPEGSILKLFGSELAGRIADFSATLLGPYATLDTPTEAVPDAPRWLHRVMGARQYTIAGGTSEIQRNIIGERVLGLPRG